MDRTEEETDELKSLLAVARKRAINFAVCLGQNHETTVFAMHRRKSPDVLGRKVKKEGETTKITTGHVRLNAKTLTLTCIEPPPPGTARQLRLFFRDFGLPLKVDILEVSGTPIDSDGQDDGGDAKEILRRTAPKPDKKAAKWADLEPAFDDAIARVVAAKDPKAPAIQAAWQGAKSAAAQGKYKTALAVAKKIKPLVTPKPAPEPGPTAAGAKPTTNPQGWAKVEARLQARLQQVLATSPANAERWTAAMDMARQKATEGDHKTAALIAHKLSDAFDKADKPAPDAGPAPPDLAAWTAAHDALVARLRNVGLAFDTTRLAKRLVAARVAAERSPDDAARALAIADEIGGELTAAGKTYFKCAKSEATAAFTAITAYRGVAQETARLKARLATMDSAFARMPPDFEDIHATHALIIAARADLRHVSERFEADYNEWMTKKAKWCDGPLAMLKDPVVSKEKAQILGSLAKAERKLNEGALIEAKRLITDAYWDIKAAQDIVAAKAGLKALKDGANAAVGRLTDEMTAGYPSEIASLTADIEQAAAKEAAGDYYTAALILKSVPAAIAELLARPAPATLADRLEQRSGKAEGDAGVEDLIATARSGDLVEARSALNKAEALIAGSEIRAAIGAGKLPPPASLKGLSASPEGRRMLDTLITEVPDEAVPGIVAARFSLDVNAAEATGPATSAPAPDLRKLHGVLAQAPDSGAALTRDMLQFEPVDIMREKDKDYTTSPGPVFHPGVSGVVYTSAFNPLDRELSAIGDPDQLGRIDPDCLSTTSSSGDNPSYGRWATMHQLGRAIDRRKKFMQANGHKPDFGGWQVHGSDLSEIGRTVARHFKIDRSFAERAMSGTRPDLPVPPDSTSDPEAAKQWQAPYAAFLNWLESVGYAHRIWNRASQTAAARIGKRVIHETAPGQWVSYDYSARTKGVTGTQFRSPGDWFAELYAAYYTNVMHPSHPARDWLSKL